MKLLRFMLLFLIGASFLNATNRFVDSGGSDTGDCSSTPCLTLQYAVGQSIAGDTINVVAGTYGPGNTCPGDMNPPGGQVIIDKSLTLLGAQAGVDARNRAASESILSYPQGLRVTASNVVLDGFTIQDSCNNVNPGYGLWLDPYPSNIDGTQIVNNIFTNNIAGIGLANQGTTQALIEHNWFLTNNNATGSGTLFSAIYTDEYVGKQTSNVLINENLFEDNAEAALNFSVSQNSFASTNFTITNNYITGSGQGMVLFNMDTVLVQGNTITNVGAPPTGSSSKAIGIFDNANNLTITDNEIFNGLQYGIRIVSVIDPNCATDFNDPLCPHANNLNINTNNIYGFLTAGMRVDTSPASPTDFATCNWWGDSSGPYNAMLNPSGMGDAVIGILISANFNPWLIGSAPDGSCGEPDPISLQKAFAPDSIYRNDRTNLVITLSNQSDNDANLTEPLIDVLPAGLEIKGISSNTCDGDLIADKRTRTIILVDGVIPHNGFCNIYVTVKGSAVGTYTNTLPEGSLVTDQGSNSEPATATLEVLPRPSGI